MVTVVVGDDHTFNLLDGAAEGGQPFLGGRLGESAVHQELAAVDVDVGSVAG